MTVKMKFHPTLPIINLSKIDIMRTLLGIIDIRTLWAIPSKLN